MTTTQILPTHPSFPTKPKSLLLPDQTTHNITSTKTLADQDLTKSVSHRSLRNSSATRMSLRSRDHPDHIMLSGETSQPTESIRKADKAPQATSSENIIHAKNDLLSSKSAGKWDRSSEETSSDKTTQACEPADSRKGSEDDTGYNTRKHGKPQESSAETEYDKDLANSKKSVGDLMANQQASGYHLRSTGTKSGYRDASYADLYAYELSGRNPSIGDTVTAQSSNQRTKGQKGSPSNIESMTGSNGEMSTTRGHNPQKSGAGKNSKHPNLNSIICNEEISSFNLQTNVAQKGRQSEVLDESSLNCAEEIEHFKGSMEVEENSDSAGSSTRSPSVARVDRHRKKESKCLNKLCLTDHKIPSLWSKEKINGSMICRVCLDAYNKEQYCYFCAQIYLDDESLACTDDKDWIECDSCGCWNHIQCEAAEGLRNIFNLLQKGRSYKYFCPPCRQGKNSKKTKSSNAHNNHDAVTSTTIKISLSPENANSNSQKKKSKTSKLEHPKPPVDDWLVCEEGLEEPVPTKVKINNERREATVEVPQVEEEKVPEEIDPIKKKLDSMFSKMSSKRKVPQWKPLVPLVESFGELDKLIVQYGGKKMQLSEQEIKADLIQLRELSKIGGIFQANSETGLGSEVEEGAKEDSSDVDVVEQKPSSRSKNSRSKQQRKSASDKDRSQRGAKEERSNRKDKEKDRENERDMKEDGKGSTSDKNTDAKMQLRIRKFN